MRYKFKRTEEQDISYRIGYKAGYKKGQDAGFASGSHCGSQKVISYLRAIFKKGCIVTGVSKEIDGTNTWEVS